MSYKYIRENKNSFAIYKSSKNYGKFNNLDDAILARDMLVDNDWNLDNINTKLIKTDNGYIIIDILDEKLCFLKKLKRKPDADEINEAIKKHKRNPNNSRYGLNITKVFDTFIIKKQIAGDDYIWYITYEGPMADQVMIISSVIMIIFQTVSLYAISLWKTTGM